MEEITTDPKEIANAFNCHYLPGEKVVVFFSQFTSLEKSYFFPAVLLSFPLVNIKDIGKQCVDFATYVAMVI